ncbi:MAG: hypothetical protein A2365_02605 [Candidatus Nealsonbacteria bacterium RIFOXYB1_FULL_40_15]|uniref:Type 4 fimbrial biogenesis protein PilX N-terminal domain-containing protein n=2 Tax=Candidatus Nealsoniibacteriota TaxID=1817911 RepID=A0A1G2EPL4_9BACT|nr:MAG: hypothetical protein A2365_02605 [Candidatus Nealsonbacteria bacterium RIFOXYB1_FULL_40_15]OGZ27492.1 MAG: hypothetical protein A2427_01460 [Candidatus Nealsonbacteria bacterium RIFOXYC1_FULL_40_7]OGZ28147.1 MAG: hypothetical protein A2562_02865 [Candidatus Nealsonbacteria bacterium RIFOXYD1_FULL_39_11]
MIKDNRGISLYLAIIVMVVLLSIIIGVSAILAKQFKMIRGMENSVVALYAADAGIETALSDIFENISNVEEVYNPHFSNEEISSRVNVYRCQFGESPCTGLGNQAIPESDDCQGYYYCIESVGEYKGVRRALFVEI